MFKWRLRWRAATRQVAGRYTAGGGPLRGRWRAATRQVAGRYAAEELEWEPFQKSLLFQPGCPFEFVVFGLV